jgi:pSer/pThr/pTyr-binding forkhead associated (FHA) protein
MGEEALAKLTWKDPHTNAQCEFVLVEGATATIGRSSNNDIQIAEQHVSRQHAVINYRDGIFMITDLGSSNGVFVNDTRITEPFPLFAGDVIRLFVPTIEFLAATDEDVSQASQTGRLILPTDIMGQASLTVTNGPQEGQTIPILLSKVTIGRATSTATWEVMLQDPSVSRPHARLEREGSQWTIVDLGSANGTRVNAVPVASKPHPINDGDTLELGFSMLVFRVGWREKR